MILEHHLTMYLAVTLLITYLTKTSTQHNTGKTIFFLQDRLRI